MFGHSKSETLSKDNIFYDFLKGLLVATLLSLGLIILFAYSMKWFSIDDQFISPFTLLIKGVCVLVGSSLAVKKGTSKGLLKGVLFGIVYIAIAFIIFSILAGTFSVGLSTVLDLAFAGLLGGIIGIIKVNKR